MFAELADTWTHPRSGEPPTVGHGREPVPVDPVQGGAVVAPGARPRRSSNRRKTLAAGPDETAAADAGSAGRGRGPRGAGRPSARIIDDTSPRSSPRWSSSSDEIGVGPRVDSPGRRVLRAHRHPRLAGRRPCPPLLGLKAEQHPRAARRSGRRQADGRHRGVRPGRVTGAPAVHRRHGLGGREPPPPVPPPHPLRPAVVAHHHRAAQRPHRPLRPGALARHPGAAAEAQPSPTSTATSGSSPGCSNASTTPTGPSASRAACSACTTPKLEEEAIAEKLREGVDARRGRPRASRPKAVRPPGPDRRRTPATNRVPAYEPPTLFASELKFVRRGAGRRVRRPRQRARPCAPRPSTPSSSRSRRRPIWCSGSRRCPAELPDRTEGGRAAACSPAIGPGAEQQSGPRPGRSTDSSWPEVGLPLAAAPVHRLAGRQGAGRGRPQRGAGHHGRRHRPIVLRAGPVLQRSGPAPAGRVDGRVTEAVGPDGGRRPVRRRWARPGSARTCPTRAAGRLRPARQPAAGDVVDAARSELADRRAAHDAELEELLAAPAERLERWVDDVAPAGVRAEKVEQRRRDRDDHDGGGAQGHRSELIDSMRTAGQPLVRVLAVLAPKGTT